MLSRIAALALMLLLAGACAGTTRTAAPASTGTGQTGAIHPPKTGSYVYDFSGQSLDPRDRTKVLNVVSGAVMTQKISAAGIEYVDEITYDRAASVTKITTRWESAKVVLLSSQTTQGTTSSLCAFQPPIEVVPIPLVSGRLPQQRWDATGCKGTVDVTVAGPVTAPDAAHHEWTTWMIEVRTQTTAGSATTTDDEKRWFSPALGIEVRTERVADGQRASGPFHNETQTALRSHP